MADETKNPKKGNSRSRNNNRSRYSKGKRNGNNGKSTEAAESKASTGARPTMDKAIANVIINSSCVAPRTIAGNPVKYPHELFPSNATDAIGSFVVPGVYAVRFAPTIGFADGKQTNPVNLAARNVWMNLRSLYSNKIPYTAGAIIKYSIALDSILCAFQFLKRVYGIIFAYDARNRYVADGIIRAMGVDPIDFRANLPDVKTYINRIATQLTAFGIPVEFRFALSHMDLCSHVYVDDTTPNAQFVITTPDFLYKLDWVNGTLIPVPWLESGTGTDIGAEWSIVKAACDTLIEAFVNYEDCYMIASDMLRLYGQLAGVGPVDDGFAIGPEYDPQFMEELHNATLNSMVSNWNNTSGSYVNFFTLTELQAVENVGAISANYCTTNYNASNMGAMVASLTPGLYDFVTSEPSIEQIVAASDWKVIWKITGNTTSAGAPMRIISCGTKIMTGISFIEMQHTNGTFTGFHTTDISAGDQGKCPSTTAMQLCHWKNHPLVPTFEWSAIVSSGVPRLVVGPSKAPFGELSQYFEIDVDDIKRIHEGIILDAFDAAGVGTLNLKAK